MKVQLVACLGLVLALAASAVEIKSDWSIVYADKSVGADGCTECALRRTAGEIAIDFEEATGWKLKVLPQSRATAETHGLWLGAPAAKAAGFEFPDWKHLENAYAEKDGNVYCFGNDRPGLEGAKPWEWHYANLPSLRATMRFMRDVVGARYLLPERTGTAVPKREKIEIAAKTYSHEKPDTIYGVTRLWLSYSFANSFYPSGPMKDYGGHSFDAACPESLFAEHPEYFAMGKNGKRGITMKGSPALCISNPQVQEMVFQEAKRYFDRGAEICQVSQNDGPVRCHCENCRALYGTGDDWNEKLWIFFRKIAERCEKECPGKIVRLLSYGETAHPPKTFKAFPSNVMMELCGYSEEAFQEWANVTVPQGYGVYLYLWGNYGSLGFTPKRSFAGLAQLVDRFKRYNVKGVYRCGYMELPGMEGPQYYYFNRLLENPKAGIADTLKEYCDAAFGEEAGEPMFRFYEALDTRLRVNDRLDMGHFEADAPDVSKWKKPDSKRKLDMLAYIYTADVVSTMDGCLAHAKRCKMTDREKTRLKRVEIEWAYARNLGRIATLYNGYWADPSFEKIEPLLKEIQWRNNYLDRVYSYKNDDPKKPDWLWFPIFWGNPRKWPQQHSRLNPIFEPLAWDVETMLRDRLAPGAPSEVARWKKYNAEKGLKPITGMRPDRDKPGVFFENRPDGRGFVFDPGPQERDLRVGRVFTEKDGIKPNTRYRLSWFVKLEDVRVTPRYREFGFFALVPTSDTTDVLEPAGGTGLVGSCDWRHMSMTFTTGDNPKFRPYIRFRLLSGCGRVEVEDVTLEELGK